MREAERLPQPCRVTQTSRGLLGLQPALPVTAVTAGRWSTGRAHANRHGERRESFSLGEGHGNLGTAAWRR